jgi:hypothetical protein
MQRIGLPQSAGGERGVAASLPVPYFLVNELKTQELLSLTFGFETFFHSLSQFARASHITWQGDSSVGMSQSLVAKLRAGRTFRAFVKAVTLMRERATPGKGALARLRLVFEKSPYRMQREMKKSGPGEKP